MGAMEIRRVWVGGFRLLLLLAWRCLAGAPCQTYANERITQRRPQLHAAGQRQRDKAAIPFIRNL